MPSLLTQQHKMWQAQRFMDLFGVQYVDQPVYMFFSLNPDWDNIAETVGTPDNSLKYFLETWDNLAGIVRIDRTDVSLVVPKNTWETQAYTQYDSNDQDLHSSEFYVTNQYSRVFKCIRSMAIGETASQPNVSAISSTVEPLITTTSGLGSTLTDGYQWKYMYNLEQLDPTNKFITTDYIPVKTLDSDDGSDQWDVQKNSVHGEIGNIYIIINSGFSVADAITIEPVSGTVNPLFAGAVATPSGNSVNYVNITNGSRDILKVANVKISTVSANNNMRAIISPVGGHGFDPEKELFASKVMISKSVTLPSPFGGNTTYNQVGIIRGPIKGISEFDKIEAGISVSGEKLGISVEQITNLLKYSGEVMYFNNIAVQDQGTETITLVLDF